MPSELTHTPVFLVGYKSYAEDEHAIYLDVEKGVCGHLARVVGSQRFDMSFAYSAPFSHPMYDETSVWMQQVGWVTHENVAFIQRLCETVKPPGRQWDDEGGELPPNRRRHSQHWASDVIGLLRWQRAMEPLGPGDNGDRFEIEHRRSPPPSSSNEKPKGEKVSDSFAPS
ncbi:uncharacterized protein DNG_02297 [Cephalotrichum gorgonifer]|uniref:Uncharacterized protein n=1 Tax=Cephalotrichum gorgonifer TaxID=2041049 RepID=A0AAE8MU85_9PEZI|nr:uncharacterized protein DNG_02297 [Cephalotrichum gorgonifer]